MIRLGLRLALATRRARIRVCLTALAVAAGVFLVLTAFAVPSAHDAARVRSALLAGASAGEPAPGPAVLWNSQAGGLQRSDGTRDILIVGAAASGPGAPALPGGAALPAAGRMLVSPALAEALRSGGAEGRRLSRRLPLPVAGTVPAALVPNPGDRVAIVGQPASALRGVANRIRDWELDAAAITTTDDTPFDRIIRLLTPVIILVPILVLVSTAARLGRRGRDEQLAAMRLIGASVRQLTLLATAEAALASVVGALAGGAAFALAARATTSFPLPTETLWSADMTPPRAAVLTAMIGIPVAATASVLLTIGRALGQPLAVRRAAGPTRPGAWRFAPLVVGWAGLVGTHWLGRGTLADLVVVASGAILVLGVVLAGPWLVRRGAAALLLGFGGRPAALLGGRRLLSDTAGGFRAVTGVAAAAFVLSAIAIWFAGVSALERDAVAQLVIPEASGLTLIDVFDPTDGPRAEAAVRRVAPDAAALRGLDVTGPGGVTLGSVVVADCAALRRVAPVGDCARPLVAAGRRDLTGRPVALSDYAGHRRTVRLDGAGTLPGPVAAALGADAVLPLGAVPPGFVGNRLRVIVPVDEADAAAGALLAAAVPAYTYAPGGTFASGFAGITTGLKGIVALSFLLGAIGLAVAGVDGVVERGRELARLQASGVGLGTLRAATALEQIGPLVLGVAGATLAGLAVGATFVLLPPDGAGDLALTVPWDQLALITLLAAGAGALVLAVTLWVLDRAVRPEALRAE